jgi:hypothetical protein
MRSEFDELSVELANLLSGFDSLQQAGSGAVHVGLGDGPIAGDVLVHPAHRQLGISGSRIGEEIFACGRCSDI